MVWIIMKKQVCRAKESKIAEGFGLGMGVMEMCGALSGMVMIIGFTNSKGNLEEGLQSKDDTFKKIRTYVQKFKE